MLKKYHKIYDLLQDILKFYEFNDIEFTTPIIEGYKLVGVRRREGYLISIYETSTGANAFALQTMNYASSIDHKISLVNNSTESGHSTNIKNVGVIETHEYEDELVYIKLSKNINLSTNEGSDEIFQMSTIYPEIITDFWAITSHYRKHGISNLYYLGWSGYLHEVVLDFMIDKLLQVKEDIQ